LVIYTLSLHDALPIWSARGDVRRRARARRVGRGAGAVPAETVARVARWLVDTDSFERVSRHAVSSWLLLRMAKLSREGKLASFVDRKSTRLNSSHQII